MSENSQTEPNPMSDTIEDRFERLAHANDTVLWNIDKKLEDIRTLLENNSDRTEDLEEAISYITNVPTQPLFLRYNHNTNELSLKRHLRMGFEGKQATLLSELFIKKNGRPKKKVFYFSELADRFESKRLDMGKAKTIYQIAVRLNGKINSEHKVGEIFVITSTKIYFARR